MFKSKLRAVLIPQSEHERLAGTLAAQWGNRDFERPALDFDAFVQAVALHDWHYGVIDNLPIGSAGEEDWLAEVQKGVDFRFDHPVTDILTKLHIKRLLGARSAPEATRMIAQVEQHISKRMPETQTTREQFEWADKITRFCDHLAFNFCFEVPARGEVGVYARECDSIETRLACQIHPGGKVSVQPWPFAVNVITGLLTGYQEAGYPDRLTPVVIPFRVEPGL